MGYAVELYFDLQTEESVWQIRRSLIAAGITATVSELGDRPHVSLAVLTLSDAGELIQVTEAFAQNISQMDFQFSAIGAFPSDENVLFLAPVLTQPLIDLHRDFHEQLAIANLPASPYYLPGNWVPHCTVEINIPDAEMAQAFDLCKTNFRPLSGRFHEIGVVEFRPIKHLASWQLD